MHLQMHFLLPYPAQCWRRLISAILQQALFSTGWLVGQWEVLEAGRMGSWLPSSTPTLSFPPSLPCSGELQPSVRPQIPPCSLLPTTASSMFLPCRSGVVTAPILASLRFLSHTLLISLHPALTSVHSLFTENSSVKTFLFFFFFGLHYMACGISVPQPGTEPGLWQ